MEYEVAEDLYKMLKRDPRTASSVKKLQLGIEVVDYERRLEWMQMNTGILQLLKRSTDPNGGLIQVFIAYCIP